MFPAFASATALRKRAFPSTSPPPERAATVISLMNFVNSLPRLASSAPFLCLILCHLECPDMGSNPSNYYVSFEAGKYTTKNRPRINADKRGSEKELKEYVFRQMHAYSFISACM